MYQRIAKILLILTVSFGILACATTNKLEQQLVDNGAKRLNSEQVTSYLSGKSQQWENGGAFFRPDGIAYVKFGGKIYPERIWLVKDDGEVCIQFIDGQNSSCSAYYDVNGKVWVVTLEIFGEKLNTVRPFRVNIDGSFDPGDKSISGGPDTVMEGNRLAEF